MSLIKHKTILTVLALPVYLFLAVIGAEGSLLCFGDDGHVAVEFVDACRGAALESQLGAVEGDACGPCRDVQFLSSPACRNNISHYTQTLPMMSPSPMSPSLPSKEYHSQDINPPEYSHHKTLASLHSVVLLI